MAPAAAPADWESDDDLLAVRLRSVAADVSRAGWSETEFAQRGFLAPGSRVSFEVSVEAGQCLGLIAIGAPGIADLDAMLFDPEGRSVAQDAGTDARPALLACAPTTERRLYFVLHAYQGAGAFLAASFSGPLASTDEAARALGVSVGAARWATVGGAGTAALEQRTAPFLRRGFEPVGSIAELSLEKAKPLRLGLEVEAGRCYAVLAWAEHSKTVPSVEITDESGRTRARAAPEGDESALQWCADESGVYSLGISAAAQVSEVRVARFSARSADIGGSRGLWLGTRIDDVASAKTTGPQRQWSVHGTLVPGEAVDYVLPALRGCARVWAEQDKSLERTELRVVDEAGRVLARGTGSVHVCADSTRPRIELSARAGAGAYVLASSRVVQNAIDDLSSLPLELRGRALDIMERARREGFSPLGVTWRELDPHALGCANLADSQSRAQCALREVVEVAPSSCLRAAAISFDPDIEPTVSLGAPGHVDAKASAAESTRCVHSGRVLVDVRAPLTQGDRLYVATFARSTRP